MERNRQTAKPLRLRKQENKNGPLLVYAEGSGVNLLLEEGCYFKDLSKDGRLHPYEDWRFSPKERAADLAARLSVEQMAGLMLYSDFNVLPASLAPVSEDTYFGEAYEEGKTPSWEVSDRQYEFMMENHGRHMLVAQIQDAKTMVNWNNSIQAMAEEQEFGIPVNLATDPRHTLDMSAEYNMASGGGISVWPESPGLAAAFDPELARTYGRMTAEDLRAMGFGTLLGPQMDIGTELRWMRYRGTFGQSPELSADLAKAYCEGLQTSYGEDEIRDGWGRASVNAIVKHWPGGGTGESGRDAHFDFGKYAVYPGGNFKEHLKPFVEGAFRLEGGTEKAGGVMPYYTISYGQDKTGENVGNAFSHYIVNDLLRVRYGYDGVVCTDWKVTQGLEPKEGLPGRCWGMEQETEAVRHMKGILSGVDQFGGNNHIGPLLEAYRMGVQAVGETDMHRRFENSARRILTVMFRLGLFENPYVEEQHTQEILHAKDHKEMGYRAQQRSVVMVKNRNQLLPQTKRLKVYIPGKYIPRKVDWFGRVSEAHWEQPANEEIAGQYFNLTKDPKEADLALVLMDGPDSGFGFEQAGTETGENGYVPISLQYGPYQAKTARRESLAWDPKTEKQGGRSYYGKTVEAKNKSDLDMVLKAREEMGEKPVVCAVNMMRPCVVKEFEPLVDGLLLHFGVEERVIYDLVTGRAEPEGLLPMQIPADMETVEGHCEDVPFDMESHCDDQGHLYDFAFGMNWKGVIDDYRVRKYKRK